MATTRNVNVDGATRPTWAMVVILVLTVVAELAEDGVRGCAKLVPARPIDYAACDTACAGWVASVGPELCSCNIPHPKEP